MIAWVKSTTLNIGRYAYKLVYNQNPEIGVLTRMCLPFAAIVNKFCLLFFPESRLKKADTYNESVKHSVKSIIEMSQENNKADHKSQTFNSSPENQLGEESSISDECSSFSLESPRNKTSKRSKPQNLELGQNQRMEASNSAPNFTLPQIVLPDLNKYENTSPVSQINQESPGFSPFGDSLVKNFNEKQGFLREKPMDFSPQKNKHTRSSIFKINYIKTLQAIADQPEGDSKRFNIPGFNTEPKSPTFPLFHHRTKSFNQERNSRTLANSRKSLSKEKRDHSSDEQKPFAINTTQQTEFNEQANGIDNKRPELTIKIHKVPEQKLKQSLPNPLKVDIHMSPASSINASDVSPIGESRIEDSFKSGAGSKELLKQIRNEKAPTPSIFKRNIKSNQDLSADKRAGNNP